jgi:hypothetical protein
MVAINCHRRDFSVDPSSPDTATCRYIATVKALIKMKDQEDMKGEYTSQASLRGKKHIIILNVFIVSPPL